VLASRACLIGSATPTSVLATLTLPPHPPQRTPRWLNQLRTDIKTGPFEPEEDEVIIQVGGGGPTQALLRRWLGRTPNWAARAAAVLLGVA
jgi:hypothetical protein